jgi:hypothetical protein
MAKNQLVVASPADQLPDFNSRIPQLKRNIQGLQKLLKELMTSGEHYGVIKGPDGYDRKVLYKAGAELMAAMFSLRPEYDVEVNRLEDGHVEAIVKCTLYRVIDGNKIFMGSGIGAATTMETKHRFRFSEAESTGKPVTQQIWTARKAWQDCKDDNKKKDLLEKYIEVLGGPGFQVGKDANNQWMIMKRGEKTENTNPYDLLNTIVKMSKKRAFVDATISTTGGSSMFGQDLGDLETDTEEPKNMEGDNGPITPEVVD